MSSHPSTSSLATDGLYVRLPHVIQGYCDGGVALWDPTDDAVFHLNDTGAEIWQHLAHPSSVRSISRGLARDYDGAPEEIRAATQRLLAELLRNGLVGNAA